MRQPPPRNRRQRRRRGYGREPGSARSVSWRLALLLLLMALAIGGARVLADLL